MKPVKQIHLRQVERQMSLSIMAATIGASKILYVATDCIQSYNERRSLAAPVREKGSNTLVADTAVFFLGEIKSVDNFS